MPILRAGLGMLPGVLELIPAAKVGVVGLQRDEATLQPVGYYEKLTGRMDERTAIILDPMLATGGTLIATVDMLKAAGCKRIKGLFLVAAPEGLRAAGGPASRTWRSTPPPSTSASTSSATSCPAWAMPATRSSAPSTMNAASCGGQPASSIRSDSHKPASAIASSTPQVIAVPQKRPNE